MKCRRLILVLVIPMLCIGCGEDTPKKQDPTSEQTENKEDPSPKAVEKSSEAEATTVGNSSPGNGPTTAAAVDGKPTDNPGTTTKTAGNDEKRIDGAVALVNGKPIDSAVFYKKVDAVLKHNSRLPAERKNRVKQSFLKRLIEDELIQQAVSAAGVMAEKESIDAEYKKYKKRFKTEEQFAQYLKRAKLTEDDIRKRIEDKKLVWLLLEKKGDLTVTETEAEEFYKKNQRFYEERETVKARHILVKVSQNAPKEEETKAIRKIQDAQKALKKGSSFEDAAKKFSEGPSAARGGLLTPFGRNQMVKPFEERAFSMKAGDISQPVRTRHGFHIIELLERREARTKPFEEVKEGILDSLRNKKFFTARRTLVADLRKNAKVEQKIAFPTSEKGGPGAVPGLPHGHPPIRAKRPKPPAVSPTRTALPKAVAPAPNPTTSSE